MNYDQPTQLRHFYRTCVNVQLSIEICMSLFAVWVGQPRYSTKATVSHWPIRNSTKAIFYHNRGKNRDGLKCGEEEKEDEPTTNPKPIVNEFLFLLLASASINNFFFLNIFFFNFLCYSPHICCYCYHGYCTCYISHRSISFWYAFVSITLNL